MIKFGFFFWSEHCQCYEMSPYMKAWKVKRLDWCVGMRVCLSKEYVSVNKPGVPNFHCEHENMMHNIDTLAATEFRLWPTDTLPNALHTHLNIIDNCWDAVKFHLQAVLTEHNVMQFHEEVTKVLRGLNDERVAKSKCNYDAVVSFIKQTTCFGPCTGPSSGLSLRVGGDSTVHVFLKRWFITGSSRPRCFAVQSCLSGYN
jgi:hypothetical protein